VPQFQIWGIGLKGRVGGLGLEAWSSRFGDWCSGGLGVKVRGIGLRS